MFEEDDPGVTTVGRVSMVDHDDTEASPDTRRGGVRLSRRGFASGDGGVTPPVQPGTAREYGLTAAVASARGRTRRHGHHRRIPSATDAHQPETVRYPAPPARSDWAKTICDFGTQ